MNDSSTRYYHFLSTTFCLLLVLSNVVASKIFRLPGTDSIVLPAGLLCYPLTFLISDCVTELWGKKQTHRMIVQALLMSLLALLLIQLVLYLPPAEEWLVEGNAFGFTTIEEYQAGYLSVFGINHILVIGSLISYLIGQLLDVWLFTKVRERTGSRYLWLRNNLSTLGSQLVDTLLMGSVYFFIALQMPLEKALPIMAAIYGYKALFSLCDTPILYLLVYLIRRRTLQELPV